MRKCPWTASLLTFTMAVAQSPTPQLEDAVIRINVNLVQVDAIVTDSKDRPVTDLKSEDFVILQDGKPQPITNFAFINTKDATVRASAPVNRAPQPKGALLAPPPPP